MTLVIEIFAKIYVFINRTEKNGSCAEMLRLLNIRSSNRFVRKFSFKEHVVFLLLSCKIYVIKE